MYTIPQPSHGGRMGCAPQLALLIALTLPLGCATKRVYEEGQTSIKRDSLLTLASHSYQALDNELSEEEYLTLLPVPTELSSRLDSLSLHAIPPLRLSPNIKETSSQAPSSAAKGYSRKPTR